MALQINIFNEILKKSEMYHKINIIKISNDYWVLNLIYFD